jgi:4'-phosphopantetheinyl transferase
MASNTVSLARVVAFRKAPGASNTVLQGRSAAAGVAATSGRPLWADPPPRPRLDDGDAAVWLLPATLERPLETVLARYLGAEPETVALVRTAAGKPELPGSPLRASLAHSGEVALVAVALGREVGVDVERPREGVERWSLAGHVLTPGEQERLQHLPAGRRGDAFLSLWTRKEAVLKAAGTGLATDPRRVEVGPDGAVSVPPELDRRGGWTVVEITLPRPGYSAALAVAGPLTRLIPVDGASLSV